MLIERGPLQDRLREDAAWLETVAEGGDDARIVAVMREAADALASLTRELEEAKALLVRASLYTDLTKFSDEIGAFLSREASD